MQWDKLSMADRAKYIKLGVSNGITDLSVIRDTYNKYDEGGTIKRYGWIYDRNSKVWKNSNGKLVGRSVYAKLPDGKRIHFNTDGTVSEVNQYGYVGKAASADPNNVEGRRSLSQHIQAEIKNQELPHTNRNYNSKQLSVRDSLYKNLLEAGFNIPQAQALIMNSADESEFVVEAQQKGGGAKGLFQFDGKERDMFEREYNNDWSIRNQAQFLYKRMKSKAGKKTKTLHNYDKRLTNDERIIGSYFLPNGDTRQFIPTDTSYMVNRNLTDSIPIEDKIHRNKYAKKINQGYKQKEPIKKGDKSSDPRISGNTSRYTGLPLNHYVDIFMSAREGDYTPEELSFMFMAGYEKAGKPHSARLDTTILK